MRAFTVKERLLSGRSVLHDRVAALKSVLSNYEELWMFFEEVSCDKSEAGAKAAGFASQLGSFKTFFNLASVDKIFTPIGTVNTEPASAASLRTAAESQRYAASS